MNFKPIAILLFSVLLAGLAVVFIYRQRNANHWEAYRSAEQQKFLNFPVDAVARLSFRNGDDEVTLLKKEGVWITEGKAAQADSVKIDAMIHYLADAKAAEYSKAMPSQLAELRLVRPGKESWAGGGILVTLQDANGAALTTILFGKKLYDKSDHEEKGAPIGRYVSRLTTPDQQPDELALLSNPLDIADDWFKRDESSTSSEPVSVEATAKKAVRKAIESVGGVVNPPPQEVPYP